MGLNITPEGGAVVKHALIDTVLRSSLHSPWALRNRMLSPTWEVRPWLSPTLNVNNAGVNAVKNSPPLFAISPLHPTVVFLAHDDGKSLSPYLETFRKSIKNGWITCRKP